MKKVFAWVLIIALLLLAAYVAITQVLPKIADTDDSVSEETAPAMEAKINCTPLINIFNSETNEYIRSVDTTVDISEIAENEYFSFALKIECEGEGSYELENICVAVNGDKPYSLGGTTLAGGKSVVAYISYEDMNNFSSHGVYSCIWSSGGKELYRGNYSVNKDMNWSEVLDMPSQEQIDAYNSESQLRSPYVAGWLQAPSDVTYSEYVIDFKADHLPLGTYCCLGNWNMDMSALKQQYAEVEIFGINGYAGFQNIDTGEKIAIMSFWDIYAKDENGSDVTIRAQRVYPETTDRSESFDNEGVGVHCSVNYDWEENHWYRMHLKCVTNPQTGNSMVEQWVCDLETGVYTLLVAYDLGYADSSFMGNMAVFLENYLTQYSGDVRSMEIRNAKYLDNATGEWEDFTGIEVYINGTVEVTEYHGTYNYGIYEDRVWFITSGVGEKEVVNGSLQFGQ